MNTKEREALTLALEAMTRFGEEGTAERYIKAKAAIKEALAQPETPYEIGQRIANTGGGMSHLLSAVSHDSELAEAERGFKDAQPKEPEQEPHSWYSKQEDEWMTHKTRKEHERLNSHTHKFGKFDLALYTHPAPQRKKD